MRSLRARTGRFREGRADERVRRFSARVSAGASTFAGRLEIHATNGSTAVRAVDGRDCAEVANALALMIALAIDPNVLTDPAKVEDAGEPILPVPAVPARPSVPEADLAVSTPSAAEGEAHPWRWSAGLSTHLALRLSPAVAYGGKFFVEAEAPASSGLDPAVRAGISFSQSDVALAAPAGAAARFDWVLGSLEACPARLSLLNRRLAAYPCLAVHSGVLRGESRGISRPRSAVAFWSDGGLVLRLRLSVAARLFFEAQAAMIVPFTRPTFQVLDMGAEATANAYSAPHIAAFVGVGAALRFR